MFRLQVSDHVSLQLIERHHAEGLFASSMPIAPISANGSVGSMVQQRQVHIRRASFQHGCNSSPMVTALHAASILRTSSLERSVYMKLIGISGKRRSAII